MDAIFARDYAGGADRYESIGHKPLAAYARLRAAEALAAQRRSSEAGEQLERALAFYRSVGATRFIRESEALLRPRSAAPVAPRRWRA